VAAEGNRERKLVYFISGTEVSRGRRKKILCFAGCRRIISMVEEIIGSSLKGRNRRKLDSDPESLLSVAKERKRHLHHQWKMKKKHGAGLAQKWWK